jgi:hypothetical protein
MEPKAGFRLPGRYRKSSSSRGSAARACSSTEQRLAVTAVTYHDRDALTRSRDEGAAIRTATITEVGLKMLEIGEFECTLAHLHVPEMA